VPVLPALAQELRTHLKGRRQGYLFESNRHTRYSARTVQAKFLQSQGETILSQITCQFSQDQGGSHRAKADGASQPQDFRPLSEELFEADRTSDKRHKHRIGFRVLGSVQPAVGQIAKTGCKTKTQQVAETEHVVREAGGIGIVFLDPQILPRARGLL